MHLTQRVREEFKENGTIVYACIWAELLNNKDTQEIITKSDKEAVIRIMRKIEKQHR